MFSFLEDLDEAVEKGCEPEKPFQSGRAQDEAHDGHEDNLGAVSSGSCTEVLPQSYI